MKGRCPNVSNLHIHNVYNVCVSAYISNHKIELKWPWGHIKNSKYLYSIIRRLSWSWFMIYDKCVLAFTLFNVSCVGNLCETIIAKYKSVWAVRVICTWKWNPTDKHPMVPASQSCMPKIAWLDHLNSVISQSEPASLSSSLH